MFEANPDYRKILLLLFFSKKNDFGSSTESGFLKNDVCRFCLEF